MEVGGTTNKPRLGVIDEVKTDLSRTMDEDCLVPLVRPKQCSKLLYPPTCPVVHTDFSRQLVTYGVIDKAFIRLDSREIVYQLKETTTTTTSVQQGRGGRNNNKPPMVVVPESELQFGRGAPVWAIPPNGVDPVAAVVLNAYVSPAQQDVHHHHEALYNVQTGDKKSVIHLCQSVKFRAPPSTLSAEPLGSCCPLAQTKKETLQPAESFVDDYDANSLDKTSLPETVQPSLNACQHESTNGENSGQDDTAEQQTQPPTTYPPVDQPGAVSISGTQGSTTLGNDCLSGKAFKSKRPFKDSFTTTRPKSKRQRREDHPIPSETVATGRHILVLPTWMDAPAVIRCFYSNLAGLETETKCKLALRGVAIKSHSLVHSKLYVVIDSPDDDNDNDNDDSILGAFRRLEDLFCDLLFDKPSTKALFMYDLARSNRQYYCIHNHVEDQCVVVVYQRDCCQKKKNRRFPFRWTTFIDLPKDVPLAAPQGGRGLLLIGSSTTKQQLGRGMTAILCRRKEKKTSCHLTVVTDWPRKGLLITSKRPEQIVRCIRRIGDHVDLPRGKIKRK